MQVTEYIYQTVGRVIGSVLPEGTNPELVIKEKLADRDVEDAMRPWTLPPELPTDLFLVSAYIVKIGGVTGFFNPDPEFSANEHGEFTLGREDRDALDGAAWIWRGGSAVVAKAMRSSI